MGQAQRARGKAQQREKNIPKGSAEILWIPETQQLIWAVVDGCISWS